MSILTGVVVITLSEATNFVPGFESYLRDGLEVPLGLLLLDRSAGLGLAVRAALGHRALAAAATHGDAVNHIA